MTLLCCKQNSETVHGSALAVARESLLFLSAHLPSPAAREAGQKTAFRNLEWLAEDYAVTLVA
jgi:hypothetical protein